MATVHRTSAAIATGWYCPAAPTGRTIRAHHATHGEVLVLGNDACPAVDCMRPHGTIGGPLEAAIDDMLRDVAPIRKQAGQRRRKLRIHQKAHQAARRTGWSLCMAANSRVAVMSAGSR